MQLRFGLVALLLACQLPKEEEEGDSGIDSGVADSGEADDTALLDTGRGGDEDEGDADYDGRCEYTYTAIGADDLVEALGVTPTEFAAAVSGTRSSTFTWTWDGAETPLDHTVTVDATTALLWTGEWIEGGGGGGETGMEPGRDETGGVGYDEEDEEGGGSSGSSGGGGTTSDTADTGDTAGEDSPRDTGAPDDTVDTGWVDPDTGAWDTGGGSDGERCADYITVQADWDFATGDGAFAESMRVTVTGHVADIGGIEHELDFASLEGTWAAPELEDPTAWDDVNIGFSAAIGVDVDSGSVSVFASRTIEGGGDTGDGEPDVDMGEAMMGDVGRWGMDVVVVE